MLNNLIKSATLLNIPFQVKFACKPFENKFTGFVIDNKCKVFLRWLLTATVNCLLGT